MTDAAVKEEPRETLESYVIDKVPRQPLCIFHAGCVDGFTSAWVVHHYFQGRVQFHEGVYQEPPPLDLIRGRNVIMVDFSYKRAVIEEIRANARSVLILDHHKTAEEDLKPFVQPYTSENADWPYFPKPGQVACFFDMNRSGAGLVWDFLFPRQPRPKLVQHVEDRDLWRFVLPGTKEINLVLYSHEFDFPTWDQMSARLMRDEGWQSMVDEGAALQRQHMKTCIQLVREGTRAMRLGSTRMPVVNAPYMFASEIGNMLAADPANPSRMGATYFDRGDGKRVFSLRSVGEADVSLIAGLYGGGGHRNAAGFSAGHLWEGEG